MNYHHRAVAKTQHGGTCGADERRDNSCMSNNKKGHGDKSTASHVHLQSRHVDLTPVLTKCAHKKIVSTYFFISYCQLCVQPACQPLCLDVVLPFQADNTFCSVCACLPQVLVLASCPPLSIIVVSVAKSSCHCGTSICISLELFSA